MHDYDAFLPISLKDMERRGYDGYDFLLITGDAYVDHPSFGAAIIGRVLEDAGYRVCIAAQPDFRENRLREIYGEPRLGVLCTSGNIDSMVAHYTASKRRRSKDEYSPGGKTGFRPDRALTVYSKMAKVAYPETPLIIGGLEASMRRFSHFDYWDERVHPPILAECGAELMVYGMGERAILEIANRLAKGHRADKITDIRGTCFMTDSRESCRFEAVECLPFEKSDNKLEFAKSCRLCYREQDPVTGKAIVCRVGGRFMVQNPPARPLSKEEMTRVYGLPYTRRWHPVYTSVGGIPALAEVEFSIIHNRGCFGGCHFCSLAFHQGRTVTSRSHESVLDEAKKIIKTPGFKGYIHDVGGPTANFRKNACSKQRESGACRDRACLAPEICPSAAKSADHKDYVYLLRKLRELPGVKKVFIRSGLRFDYIMADKDRTFLRELTRHHVSGQLKVAPEHCAENALLAMGKPSFDIYLRFREAFLEESRRAGLEQYLVPYFISAHPGATLNDAIELAYTLKSTGHACPEQVQDFYPTPGTLSTCMYYTGYDPLTLKPVYLPTSEERELSRALLQWRKKENRPLVLKALRLAGREDLAGFFYPELKNEKSRTGAKTQKSPPRDKNPKKRRTDAPWKR